MKVFNSGGGGGDGSDMVWQRDDDNEDVKVVAHMTEQSGKNGEDGHCRFVCCHHFLLVLGTIERRTNQNPC
jgi:hypothetical protein